MENESQSLTFCISCGRNVSPYSFSSKAYTDLYEYGKEPSDYIGKEGVISYRCELVGVTKTEPLRELVWESRKDPDHERQKIHDGAEDPHIARG